MSLKDPVEAARRVRAARAYAGLTRAELVRLGPLSDKQLKMLEEGRRPITTRTELHALAANCGVPPEFMDGGFLGAEEVYEKLALMFTAVLSQDFGQLQAVAKQLGLKPPEVNPVGPSHAEAPPPSEPGQPSAAVADGTGAEAPAPRGSPETRTR